MKAVKFDSAAERLYRLQSIITGLFKQGTRSSVSKNTQNIAFSLHFLYYFSGSSYTMN